jgi:hypothetical protein
VKLVLGNSRGDGVRGPIFLGVMRDLRPAPSPENGFAGFWLSLVSYRPLAHFLGCQLLHCWRLWAASDQRTCLITDHIHRCYPELVVRQRCGTWLQTKKGCQS